MDSESMPPRPPKFLTWVLGDIGRDVKSDGPSWRPFVTVTFAQSMDAKIAGRNGQQLILSGRESMIMTHWMRTMHDGILVGVGTAINDDPQLNVRHLPVVPSHDGSVSVAEPYALPRPIILDSQLRLPIGCKLLKNFSEGRGRRPWVICSSPNQVNEGDKVARRQALEAAGAIVFDVAEANGRLHIPAVLRLARGLSIGSLMVEGGAEVIGSFLGESGCVDRVIVTIAPVFVGEEGIGYCGKGRGLEYVESEQMGRDTVVAFKSDYK